MPSVAQRRIRRSSLNSLLYLFGNLELLAGSQLLGVHAVSAHELVDADLVFTGDFPEVVSGFDGVDFFLGFLRGWSGRLEGSAGLEDDKLGFGGGFGLR